MANSNPPKKNQAFTTRLPLEDYALPGNHKLNPTIAAGDFKVTTDGGAEANLATLPSVSPAAGASVLFSLSAGEMNGDSVAVIGIDQTAPKEWADFYLSINTTA